ncbi:MAG: Rrf2 family transcriptional regulator [Candidatus Omnitrophica bacterium]|nr:Rrf2 family transcriptional regulator [Candidatus Omnitrophota bacterium]
MMKLITKDTDYAIRALSYLSLYPERIVTVAQLSRELDIPQPFLRRILQRLSAAGVLRSQKGKQGGFRLARLPDTIQLQEVIRIFQGPLTLMECLKNPKTCVNSSTCPLHRKMKEIQQDLRKKLDGITVASLSGKGAA